MHGISLFLALDLFKTKEFLSVVLVQLRRDIINGIFDFWNHYILDGIDPSVGCPDDLVQNEKGRLDG